MGSRQTRRGRRARKRRARQRELAGTGVRLAWRVLGGAWILVSLVGVFVAAFTGEDRLIILFGLSAVLVYGLLWLGERMR